MTYLQKGVDMLFLKFIRPKYFNTTASLLIGEPLVVTLE